LRWQSALLGVIGWYPKFVMHAPDVGVLDFDIHARFERPSWDSHQLEYEQRE